MPKKQTARKLPVERRKVRKNHLPASAPEPAELPLNQLPDHSTSAGLRQAGMLQAQRQQGNQAAGRLVQSTGQLNIPASQGPIQREKGKSKAKGGGTHGRGSGALKKAKEVPYEVSGATLNDLTGQLKRFGGFGAEYTADLTIKGKAKVKKTKEGQLMIKVQWKLVDAQVQLPHWADYDQACPAAQSEWDRFMGALRAHEQTKHIDMAEDFIKNLSGEDVEIVADTKEELQTRLEDKQIELRDKLQAEHDACGHGTGSSGDAVLNPDAGICEEETQEQAEDFSSI